MAWDADAIADQLEKAMERQEEANQLSAVRLTPEQRAQNARLESLRMSYSRTLSQLERATNPAHKEMLNKALRSLESQIKDSQS
jgi:hypothetical protein